jgi:hypothetical protein
VDYAFAPGPTKYDQQMGRLLDDRPTCDLMRASLGTVEHFIDELETLSSIIKPVDSMFIASHANDTGQLKIKVDDAQTDKFADYETIEAAQASGTLRIPSILRTLPNGQPHPGTMVRIRGCRVGVAEPFMDKLKEAFGGAVKVTAPKHFHAVWPKPPYYPNEFGGLFEWLVYDFGVHSKTALSRTQIIKALKDRKFDFYDGTKVPDAWWEDRVPKKKTEKSQEFGMRLILGTSVGPKNTTELLTTDSRAWRHQTPGFFGGNLAYASKPAPATVINDLKTRLPGEPNMQSTHAFPIWKRFGYESFDDFWDGVNWKQTWNGKKGKIAATAWRHEYHLLMPITTRTASDKDAGNLIFNYFPHGGTGAAFFSMRDDDAFLFHTA